MADEHARRIPAPPLSHAEATAHEKYARGWSLHAPIADARLRGTLEALSDHAQVHWLQDRAGRDAAPAPNELLIDVALQSEGAPEHPRLFDWKLPQWRERKVRCSLEAVLGSAEALDALGAALRKEPGRLALPLAITVSEPSLDCLSAALLAAYRVLWTDWPEGISELKEFVSEWEQGRHEEAGAYERSLASVFYAMRRLFHVGSDCRPAHVLVELLAAVIDKRLDHAALGHLPEELIPGRIRRRLKADADLYRAELSRARRVQLDLPLEAGDGASTRRVDALFVSSAQDVTVLELLARADAEHSSAGHGFDVLVVHAPNQAKPYHRHTLSMGPERSGTLADLAARLDVLEGGLTPDGRPRAQGKRFADQPNAYADPWYSDGYTWPHGRSTLVAPPYAGTRLTREELWEAIWARFNVGRNIRVTAALTLLVRPYRLSRRLHRDAFAALGFLPETPSGDTEALLPTLVQSFLGEPRIADVEHLLRERDGQRVHLSLYPNDLALVWVERRLGAETSLFELATEQARLARQPGLTLAPGLEPVESELEPLLSSRWLVYGAYRIDRAGSTMLDGSRSVLGLFHALASGTEPTLRGLPSEEAVASRRVLRDESGDVEHWFTSAGGARLELGLEPRASAPLAVDRDFVLFLATTGQRHALLEIDRRMGEVERQARTSRWQNLRPVADVRGDVMFFTNSLWYLRASDEPDVDARYRAWHDLHGMDETVEAVRNQTAELDAFRKERFEGLVGLLVFVFLPITIVCGFFSGAQFNDMPLRVGLPWTTGGWKIFLIYTAVFTVLVFGTWTLSKLVSWRRR